MNKYDLRVGMIALFENGHYGKVVPEGILNDRNALLETERLSMNLKLKYNSHGWNVVALYQEFWKRNDKEC